MGVRHIFSNSVPDGPITSIVRPSDWNSAHEQAYTLVGNTAGNSTISGTNIMFAGGNNVTLSGSGETVIINAGGGGGGAALSAGTNSTSTGTVVFSNANGVSFGMNTDGVITATVAPGAAAGMGAIGAGTQTQTSGTVLFSNSNNITFGMSNSSVITASASFAQSTQPAVQSLNGSSGAIILNVGSSLSASTNGSSITFGLASNITTALQSAGAYLTTAAQSNHSHNFATTTTGGSLIVVGTTNSAGATIGVPAFITSSPAQSNQTGNLYVTANSTQLSSTAGVDLRSISFAGAGIASVGVSQGVVVVSVPSGGGVGDGGNIVMAGTAGTTGTTFSSSLGTVQINGGNNITVSQNGSNQIIISAAQGGIAAGSQTATSGTLVFANSNGVTFGMSGSSQITASIAAAGGAQTGISSVAVSNTTYTSGQISFRDGNNISFASGTGQAISVTHNLQSAGAYLTTAMQSNAVTLSNINVSAGTTSSNQSSLGFSNANGMSFGFSGASITGSYTVPTVPTAYVSSINGSSGAISLNVGSSLSASTNGSSITFGLASNITTALQSAGAYVTTAAQSNHSHNFATTTTNGSLIVVATTNSAGATIAVPPYITAAAGGGIAVSLSGNSTSAGAGYSNITSGTAFFAGGNNITLSQNGASITISGANVGGAQTGISSIALSNTTYTSGQISFSDANGISFGSGAGQAINITHGLQFTSNTSAITSNALNTSASKVAGIIANTNNAGGGTATLTGNVSFSNANGLSFYTSAGNAVVGSYTVPTVPTAYVSSINGSSGAISLNVGSSLSASTNGSSITFGLASNITTALQSAGAYLTTAAQSSVSNVSGIIAGTASNGGTATLSGNVSFSNANGISFFTSAGNAVVGTVRTDYQSAGAYLTTAMQSNAVTLSNIRVSGGTTSNLLSAITFADGGGVSFGLNAGTMTATIATTYAASNHSHGNPTLALTNLSGTTASNSAGLTLSLSAAAAGAANINFSAGTTSGNIGSVVFSNLNGVSFGLNGSTITASAAGGGGAFSAGISTNGNTSGTTGFAASQVLFQGGNNITLSQLTGAGGSNTLIISAAQGGIAAGSQTATSGTLVFANSNGVTFGMSGSSQITASVNAGGGAAATISNWEPYPPIGGGVAFSTLGQNSIYLQRLQPPVNVAFANIERRMSGSFVSSTNSQAATHTYHYGLYSRGTGASTSIYSQIGSSQIIFQASISSNVSAGFTISQGAGSFTSTSAGTALYSLITGYKHLYMNYADTLTAGGDYAVAMRMSSATAVGTNALRIGVQDLSVFNNLTIGKIFATTAIASNASFVGEFAQGVYSATSSNLPSTIALSGLTNAVSQQRMYLQFDN